MQTAAVSSPSLSVVVATSHPWPELAATMATLWPQALELGAEVIIADGDGHGVPDDFSTRFPGAVHFRKPGASVFLLRALAMQQARGDIVAMTEDHCRLPSDWCRRLVAAHLAYPEAAAVGGAVENGSTSKWIDWANYFVAHSPMMSPIAGGKAREISLQAGMAYKRRALPKTVPEHGVMEMLYVPELVRQGEILVADSAISVFHVQSHGFWRTFATHFHNGRSIAGFRKRELRGSQLFFRMAACFLLPAHLLVRATRCVFRKRRFRRRLLVSLPLMAPLACCHAAGEFAGYCAGEGNSPEQLS